MLIYLDIGGEFVDDGILFIGSLMLFCGVLVFIIFICS